MRLLIQITLETTSFFFFRLEDGGWKSNYTVSINKILEKYHVDLWHQIYYQVIIQTSLCSLEGVGRVLLGNKV